jgi:GDP-L-fucose synthase
MAENIILASRNCKLVIFFGSGAEFDRETNIENATEDDIQSCIPKDFYGLSKNLISKRILSIPNIIILRIFNCFGYGEVPNRFITSAIKNNPLIIHQNKYMDFFYIEDLYNIILYYIQNFPNVPYKDLNCVYQLKYTLIDIAHLVKNLNIKIEQEKLALSYTGNGYKLTKLPIKLKGLTQSLEEFHRLII